MCRPMERAHRVTGLTAPVIVLACMLLAWCPAAFALNPALDVSQYAHTTWKIRDGFPKGQVISIAQTPDGYLWLGTEFGLFRFDGVRSVAWQPPVDQQLPSNQIWSLLAARDGTLWIGTSNGLASWKSGKLTQHAELVGQYIFKLLEDHEGSVWASGLTVTTGRLCAIRTDNVQCYGEDGSLGRGAFNLYEDRKGNLWAGVTTGLWRWKPGPPRFYPLAGEPDGIQALGEDDDGALLVGWHGGVQRFVEGKTEPHLPPSTMGQFRTRRMLRDRDGGLWIGTVNRGLVHVHQGRTDSYAQPDGLAGQDILTLFEDREGNIWVATPNGLDRFRDFAIATFDVNQGLSNAIVGSVLADRDGSMWIGTYGGLNRWNSGQITAFGNHSPPARSSASPMNRSDKSDAKPSGFVPHSLFRDKSGRIWVSTAKGVGYLENDRFISVSGVPTGNALSMVEDSAGNLWIANEQFGLLRLIHGSEVQQFAWSGLGHKDHASALAADTLRGGLWLGFHLGGLAYFTDGQVHASYTPADGLGQGRVNQLQLDQDGTLWAATEGGLSRLRNGRVATLNSKNGLPCDTVHWVMEDDAGSFWLNTACGLVRIARTELDGWAAAVDQGNDAQRALQTTAFDSSDGVRTFAADSHYSPTVAKSSDGTLWFTSLEAVSVIDPRHLAFNSLPPPVHIEQISADRKTYDATSDPTGRLRLPPLSRDLGIDYTALSLVAPEKILFRYKLEGHDRDWQEVGNRRQAFYNDLPPGNYRFRVMACNNSGVWNEAGTYLDFSIAPAYYQTTWFRMLAVFLFLLVLGALYQLRVRQVAQQVRGRMEERLDERERIARDLHDTLLQSVQGLILKFHAVSKQIPHSDPAHDALEKTLDHADQVLAEGRDRVRNLRGTTIPIGGLPAAFKQVVEETPQGSEVTFKTVVEGSVRELHPMVREESFCIGREALINALTHSQGLQVEVEITYDSRQFRLRVRDDGCGFDPEIMAEGGRPDHWGLQGMRERAQRIGGQLEVWSRPKTGTEVELIVPAATAYRKGLKSRRFWVRKSSSLD